MLREHVISAGGNLGKTVRSKYRPIQQIACYRAKLSGNARRFKTIMGMSEFDLLLAKVERHTLKALQEAPKARNRGRAQVRA